MKESADKDCLLTSKSKLSKSDLCFFQIGFSRTDFKLSFSRLNADINSQNFILVDAFKGLS